MTLVNWKWGGSWEQTGLLLVIFCLLISFAFYDLAESLILWLKSLWFHKQDEVGVFFGGDDDRHFQAILLPLPFSTTALHLQLLIQHPTIQLFSPIHSVPPCYFCTTLFPSQTQFLSWKDSNLSIYPFPKTKLWSGLGRQCILSILPPLKKWHPMSQHKM